MTSNLVCPHAMQLCRRCRRAHCVLYTTLVSCYWYRMQQTHLRVSICSKGSNHIQTLANQSSLNKKRIWSVQINFAAEDTKRQIISRLGSSHNRDFFCIRNVSESLVFNVQPDSMFHAPRFLKKTPFFFLLSTPLFPILTHQTNFRALERFGTFQYDFWHDQMTDKDVRFHNLSSLIQEFVFLYMCFYSVRSWLQMRNVWVRQKRRKTHLLFEENRCHVWLECASSVS